MVSTELGKIVNKLLCENFADVINVEFTAIVETEFDNIAEGQFRYLTSDEIAKLLEFNQKRWNLCEINRKNSKKS